MDDVGALAPADVAASPWGEAFGVHAGEDLSFAAVAGQEQECPAGVADSLQEWAVHRSDGSGDRAGQDDVESGVPGGGEVRGERGEVFDAAGAHDVVVVDDEDDTGRGREGGGVELGSAASSVAMEDASPEACVVVRACAARYASGIEMVESAGDGNFTYFVDHGYTGE